MAYRSLPKSNLSTPCHSDTTARSSAAAATLRGTNAQAPLQQCRDDSFCNVSGNVGLFSTRAAVEIVKHYALVRELTAHAQEIIDLQDSDGVDRIKLRNALADHLRLLRVTRRRGIVLVRTLRQETPGDMDQMWRTSWRRLLIRLRQFYSTSIARNRPM